MTIRGAYIDQKGVRWDTNNADFEGYLMKQSYWVKGSILRIIVYIVLKLFKLFYINILEYRMEK